MTRLVALQRLLAPPTDRHLIRIYPDLYINYLRRPKKAYASDGLVYRSITDSSLSGL